MSEREPPNVNLRYSVSRFYPDETSANFQNRLVAYLYTDDTNNTNTLILRNDRSQRQGRRSQRHPTPYPVHVHTLSTQHREAERRRASMTINPSTSNSYIPQIRGIRLPSILHARQLPLQPVLPRSSIETLTYCKNVTQDDTSDSCVICQSLFELGQNIRVLLCNHKFHKPCIDEWFNNSVTCCICRKGIDGLPYEPEEIGSTLTVMFEPTNDDDDVENENQPEEPQAADENEQQ